MSRPNCVMCNHPMRQAQVKLADAPGTRQHRAQGLCKSCYYLERRAGNIPDPEGRRGRKPRDSDVETSQFAYMFDQAAASAALEGWLQARRRRLARLA